MKSSYIFRISKIGIVTLTAIVFLSACIAKRALVPPVTNNEKEQRTYKDLEKGGSIRTQIDLEHEYIEDVELSYRIRDDKGEYYVLGDNDNPIRSIEAYIDSQWVTINDWRLIEKDLSNCIPHDYTLILDMSGSMKENESLISQEVHSFINYKNDEDYVGLIKYATHPLLVSNFSKNKQTLTDSLFHKADTAIGAFTKTDLAYVLFNKELKMESPNRAQSVILFSDLSGASNEKFDSLASLNYENGIKTHKVVYFQEEEKRSFFFRFLYSKEQIKRVFNPQYGEVFRVEDFQSIGESLKRVIDQNCIYNKILFERPKNATTYRVISEINGKQMVGEIQSIIPPEDNVEISTDSVVNYKDESFRVGEPILLQVYFDTGSDSLLAESNEEIERVFEIMTEYPEMNIEIRGHTDNRGAKEFNIELSERRANAVKNALIIKGIDDSRMSAMGLGYSRPVATNETLEGRAKNRRTEFVIVKK